MRARPRGPDTHPLTPRTHVDSLGDAIARFEWKLECHMGHGCAGAGGLYWIEQNRVHQFLNGHHSNIY